MKKNYFCLLALATALLQLSSCSSSDDPKTPDSNTGPAELKISANMQMSVAQARTRGAYNLQGTTLNDMTNIGIYAWKTGETAPVTSYAGYANNKVDSYTGASAPYTLSPTTPIYFPVDNSDIDVYLYAPYNASPTVDGDMVMNFSIQSDQSTDANYILSDYLFGKATAVYNGAVSPAVNKRADVTMYHALSKIILKIEAPVGVSVAGLTNLKITSVKPDTQIRMANGSAADMTVGSDPTDHLAIASGTPGDVIVTTATGFDPAVANTNGYAAIIPPQSMTSMGISITVDGKTATGSLSGGLNYGAGPTNITTFDPSKVYTITLKVSGGDALSIQLVEIVDWVSGNGSGSELNLGPWS